MTTRIAGTSIQALFLAAVLSTLPGLLFAQAADRPDILFIAIDDMNDWISPLTGTPRPSHPIWKGSQSAASCSPRTLARGRLQRFAHVHADRAAAIHDGRVLQSEHLAGKRARHQRTGRCPAISWTRAMKRSAPARSSTATTTTGQPGIHTIRRWITSGQARPRRRDVCQPTATTSAAQPSIGARSSPRIRRPGTASCGLDGEAPEFGERGTAVQCRRFSPPHQPWYVPYKYFDMHPIEAVKLPPIVETTWMNVPVAALRGNFVTEGSSINGQTNQQLHQWVLENDQWHAAVQGNLASISFVDAMLGRGAGWARPERASEQYDTRGVRGSRVSRRREVRLTQRKRYGASRLEWRCSL